MTYRIDLYYRTQVQLSKIEKNLKQYACPFCHLVGTLILHGYLYGNEEASSHNNKEIRGRRVLCNARRKKRTGCGRTVSIKVAKRIPNFCITAQSLWSFLVDVLNGKSKSAAFKKVAKNMHPSSAYRLWRRFEKSQSRIRSLLTRDHPRATLPVTSSPATQTVAHMKSVFKGKRSLITAFQMQFQASFF